jgi:hypothetical protein
MTSITSDARFRQRVIQYAEKKGVTKAADRYRVSRNSIYRWKNRYDGSWQSLKERSHRPHHHPAEHTQEEYDLIRRYWYRNKDDRMILWMKIREQDAFAAYLLTLPGSPENALSALRLDLPGPAADR